MELETDSCVTSCRHRELNLGSLQLLVSFLSRTWLLPDNTPLQLSPSRDLGQTRLGYGPRVSEHTCAFLFLITCVCVGGFFVQPYMAEFLSVFNRPSWACYLYSSPVPGLKANEHHQVLVWICKKNTPADLFKCPRTNSELSESTRRDSSPRKEPEFCSLNWKASEPGSSFICTFPRFSPHRINQLFKKVDCMWTN